MWAGAVVAASLLLAPGYGLGAPLQTTAAQHTPLRHLLPGAGNEARSAHTATPEAIGPSGPVANNGPLLGTYDPDALQVPTGSEHALDPEAELWSGSGDAIVPEANFTWSVDPPTLGTVSSSGEFYAGAAPGNGTIAVVATVNGSETTDEVAVVVYSPDCILLDLGFGSYLSVDPGENLTVDPTLLDQVGDPCGGVLSPSWSLDPATFGALSPAGAGVVLHVLAHAGSAWLNASVELNGTVRTASVEVGIPPSNLGEILNVYPTSLVVAPGETATVFCDVSDGSATSPPAACNFTLAPAALGSLGVSSSEASFTAGSLPGSGEILVRYEGSTGNLSASIAVAVSGPSPAPLPVTGISAPYLETPPLLPGQGIDLTVQGLDPFGLLSSQSLNVSWTLTPGDLGRLVPTGSSAIFVAGNAPGNGTVVAEVEPNGSNVQWTVPFPIEVVRPSVSAVVLPGFGGPATELPVGSSTYLEGTDQDLFGNLLLGGGYYGLTYGDMDVDWSVEPSSLGTVVPLDNGSSSELPEAALFIAGASAGAGEVEESISWAGLTRTVEFPISVYAPIPSAVTLVPPASVSPYGGVAPGSTVDLSALLLDQLGNTVGAQGNFSWELTPGSDASLTGAPFGPSVTLRMGSYVGVALGNVTWSDAGAGGKAEFVLSVIRAMTNASTISITAGGPSSLIDAVDGSASESVGQPGVQVVVAGSVGTFGTTAVPGAEGPATWTLYPRALGSLSNSQGTEVNVTFNSSSAQEGWLNATVIGPGGEVLSSSLAFTTYVPTLAAVVDLTGPCVASCSNGLATFEGNDAFVALEAVDPFGSPFSAVNWTGVVSPGELASISEGPYLFGAASELFRVQANGSAGNGTVTLTARVGSTSQPFSLPLEVLPLSSAAAPGLPQRLGVNTTSSELEVRWASPSTSGSAPLVNYTVEVAVGNATPRVASGAYSDPSGSEFILGNLPAGTTFWVRVRAWNGLGLAGPWTVWAEARTWGPPPTSSLPSFGSSVSGEVLASVLLLALGAATLFVLVWDTLGRGKASLKRRGAGPHGGAPPQRPPGPPGQVLPEGGAPPPAPARSPPSPRGGP